MEKMDFIKTCRCCPEQYNVMIDNKQVAYVRLRWGNLTVECPDVDGEEIFRAEIGSSFCGEFESEEQRKHYLNLITEKIKEWVNK